MMGRTEKLKKRIKEYDNRCNSPFEKSVKTLMDRAELKGRQEMAKEIFDWLYNNDECEVCGVIAEAKKKFMEGGE